MMNVNEKGFALIDALIAAVIAAAVAISCAQGLGVASRMTRTASNLDQTIMEAETIDARLSAGIKTDTLQQSYPNWQFSELPFAPSSNTDQNVSYAASRIEITHLISPPYSFERITISRSRQ